MFKKIFKNKESEKLQRDRSEQAPAVIHESPATESLLKTIAEKKKDDPQIGLKIGAQEINNRLMSALKNEKGVHVESLLSILGALGGYACQISVREEFVNTGKVPEKQAFMIVESKDGRKFFFGDSINKPLAENPYSIWGLTGGAAQQAGCQQLPDLNEIFTYVTKSVGENHFGIPRIPDSNKPSDIPVNYVKALWPKLLPIANMFCDKPSEWPIIFGMAIYKVIEMAKGAIDPGLAAKIVMESAIPMSKIDPAELFAQQ